MSYRAELRRGAYIIFDADSFHFTTERVHTGIKPEIEDRILVTARLKGDVTASIFADQLAKLEPRP